MADLDGVQQEVVEFARSNMGSSEFENFMVMCDYLGVPTVKPTIQMCRSKSHLQLWELWYGQNEFLQTAIEKDITENGSWVTQLFPQQDFKGGVKGTLVRMIFESQVLEETPSMLPNSILEMSEEQEEFALITKGATFILDNDFMFAPNGQELFGLYCRNLERCIDQTMSENILKTIKKTAVEQMIKQFPPMPMDAQEFYRLAQEFVSNFAILQKSNDGITNLNSGAIARMSGDGARPDTAIIPQRALRYVKNIAPQHTTYSQGGNQIGDKAITEPKQQGIASAHYGLTIHESVPFKGAYNVRGRVSDPWFEIRTIGTFAPAYDITLDQVSDDKYRTSHRSIEVGSMQTNYHTFSLMDMIEGACLFADSGAPTSLGNLTPEGRGVIRAIVHYNYTKRGVPIPKSNEAASVYKRPRRGDGLGLGPRPATYTDGPDSDDEDDGYGGSDNGDSAVPQTLEALYDSAGQLERLITHLTPTDDKDEVVMQSVRERLAKTTKNAKESGSSNNPARVKALLQQTDVSQRALRVLAEANIRIPLNFLLCRRPRFEAGLYVAMKKGKETGVLYTTRVIVEVVRNGLNRQVGVNLNWTYNTVIHTRANFCIIPDVLVQKYLGGYGASVWLPSDNYESRKMVFAKDMHILAVPSTWRAENNYIDLSGTVNPNMLQSSSLKPQPCYPTADAYRRIHHFSDPCHLFVRSAFISQNAHEHTFLWQEPYRNCVPAELLQGNAQTYHYGTGHMGRTITPQSLSSLRGSDDHMGNADYDSRATIVAGVRA